MAFLKMDFVSETLMRTVTVNVILPADKVSEPGMPKQEDQPYKTLYLLHGVLGNHTDWVHKTRIQALAEKYNLAVVMPAGENLFYLDYEPIHAMYGEFIGKELVEFTRRIFPLSHKREDTFIGGLSMGGYGALRNGLKYAETFGRIVGLSAAAVLYDLKDRTDDEGMFFETASYAKFVFGDPDQAMESDKNPVWIAKQRKEQGKVLPEIYLACGTEDFLLEANRRMRRELEEAGVKPEYVEAPGAHEWPFWDEHIEKAIVDWLPVSEAEAGLNSGNVGVTNEK